MREEIKMEYVGYSALLITYYWYHPNGNYSLENVPYLCDGNFSDFKERVLNYIGASVSDKTWIKRAISDCAHDFYQKELKHNTRQFLMAHICLPLVEKLHGMKLLKYYFNHVMF